MTDPKPITWRVWGEYHSVKISSSKPPLREFHDLETEEAAIAFKHSLRDRFPYSVFCIEPIYVRKGWYAAWQPAVAAMNKRAMPARERARLLWAESTN